MFYALNSNSNCFLGDATHKILDRQDQEIGHQNKKIKHALESAEATHEEFERCVQSSSNDGVIGRAQKKREKALTAYQKAAAMSAEKIGTGSGKVGLLLPSRFDHPRHGNGSM